MPRPCCCLQCCMLVLQSSWPATTMKTFTSLAPPIATGPNTPSATRATGIMPQVSGITAQRASGGLLPPH